MKRVNRLKLEELSLQAYGTKTRYKKMLDRGIVSDLVDDAGKKYRGIQRFDLDGIEAVMHEEIEEKKRQQEEKEKKENESRA